VGKSCIFNRAIDPKWQFKEEMNATIAVTKPVLKRVQLDDGEFPLKVWDCGGQERFDNISKAFLKDAIGCILIFSVESPESLKKVRQWIESVIELRNNGKDIQIAIACNKIDLPETHSNYFNSWKADGEGLARGCSTEEYPIKFFAISAKTDIGISEMFRGVARQARDRIIKRKKTSEAANNSPPAPDHESGGGCCTIA